MQHDEDGDYEDREGENMYAEVEDPYITDKEYKCEKCNKKKKVKSGTLFAPFCHDRPMKLLHRLEHKFDFETITKRSVEKEKQLFPNSAKSVKKATTTKPAKKKSAKKAKAVTKKKKAKSRK
ncbi:MAG: hypothetical protein Q8R15_00615 [Candidatus Micrarchaeota archaeon]|nr:hypothetical protein [Candidatus Micrarchaeota archaeon]